MKLAVIVPYRDRAEHLKRFIPAITQQLEAESIDFDIHVVEQSNTGLFNKGKTCNTGFALTPGYDWYCFHDVDAVPLMNGDYSKPTNSAIALHGMSSKLGFEADLSTNMGLACIFLAADFELINGFSNNYWGWGAEDNDLTWRCVNKGVKIDKRPIIYEHFEDLVTADMSHYKENCEYITSQYDYNEDGLNTLRFSLIKTQSLNGYSHHLVEFGSR